MLMYPGPAFLLAQGQTVFSHRLLTYDPPAKISTHQHYSVTLQLWVLLASAGSVCDAGMARMRHTLQALQGRAQAAIALADKGSASLVQSLSGILPTLANSGEHLPLPMHALLTFGR